MGLDGWGVAGLLKRLREWGVGRFILGLCGGRVREKEVKGWVWRIRVREIEGLKGWGRNGVIWVNGRRDKELLVEQWG